MMLVECPSGGVFWSVDTCGIIEGSRDRVCCSLKNGG
jgi:hypothetical protein